MSFKFLLALVMSTLALSPVSVDAMKKAAPGSPERADDSPQARLSAILSSIRVCYPYLPEDLQRSWGEELRTKNIPLFARRPCTLEREGLRHRFGQMNLPDNFSSIFLALETSPPALYGALVARVFPAVHAWRELYFEKVEKKEGQDITSWDLHAYIKWVAGISVIPHHPSPLVLGDPRWDRILSFALQRSLYVMRLTDSTTLEMVDRQLIEGSRPLLVLLTESPQKVQRLVPIDEAPLVMEMS